MYVAFVKLIRAKFNIYTVHRLKQALFRLCHSSCNSLLPDKIAKINSLFKLGRWIKRAFLRQITGALRLIFLFCFATVSPNFFWSNMRNEIYGKILDGNEEALKHSYDCFAAQECDLELISEEESPCNGRQTTIAEPVRVQGGGTFSNKSITSMEFLPAESGGWWFDRTDLPDALPTRVSIRNVWTTGYLVSNIVLRSGDPHNYVRMVEHIIALKQGLNIDNVIVRMDSGDPPLFDRGSLDLIEALDGVGRKELDKPIRYFTVKERCSICNDRGSFLIFEPAENGRRQVDMDCAIDFKTAIGKQRLRVTLTEEQFRHGAVARTNTSAARKFYCTTIGKLFADVRNLGYTRNNILIAGGNGYINEPKLVHDGKALEAIWHRAALDLNAALNLMDEGRFAGKVISYKAGHSLDVKMIAQLYLNDMLVEMTKE